MHPPAYNRWMFRFLPLAAVACASLLAACGSATSPVPGPGGRDIAPRDTLLRIVDRYWDDYQHLNPPYPVLGDVLRFGNSLGNAIAVQKLADSLAMERRYLLEVLAIPRAGLDAEAGLTYEIFRRERMLAVESYKYPTELLPVNPFDGVAQRFALAASTSAVGGVGREDWDSRADAFVEWSHDAIANLRDGMRRGYTVPRVVVEETLPVLAALGADTTANVFYKLVYPPDNSRDAEQGRREALIAVVRDKILPAYRSLHEFLQTEYLPRARESIGLSALPLGDAWYAFLIKRETGGSQTAAALHAQGLAEVERLHLLMKGVLADAGFTGDAVAFMETLRDPRFGSTTPPQLSAAVQDARAQLSAVLPAVFSSSPHADFEIREIESFRAAGAPPLSYVRAVTSGRNAAILYLGTAGLESRPAIAVTADFLREALPGHHWQLALQQERTDLPRFRRWGGDAAFIQGWGLYAAGLGEELGMYVTPQAKFGLLMAQLDCATGLVLDTGVHAEGWTRPQALDYLRVQFPADEAAAAEKIDRIIALPGEALSCTVGEMEFKALRSRAQQSLGERFDVRAYHEELLADGAMPLDLLEGRLRRWMDAVP